MKDKMGRDSINRRNSKLKLSLKDVETIRKSWPDKSQSQLAREYRINPSTVHRIVNNMTRMIS